MGGGLGVGAASPAQSRSLVRHGPSRRDTVLQWYGCIRQRQAEKSPSPHATNLRRALCTGAEGVLGLDVRSRDSATLVRVPRGSARRTKSSEVAPGCQKGTSGRENPALRIVGLRRQQFRSRSRSYPRAATNDLMASVMRLQAAGKLRHIVHWQGTSTREVVERFPQIAPFFGGYCRPRTARGPQVRRQLDR